MFEYFSDENLSTKNGQSSTVSMVNWLVFQSLALLNIIPVIGVLLWLGFYICLAAKITTAPSIRNYIKLNLILAVVSTIVICAVCLACDFNLFSLFT